MSNIGHLTMPNFTTSHHGRLDQDDQHNDQEHKDRYVAQDRLAVMDLEGQ